MYITGNKLENFPTYSVLPQPKSPDCAFKLVVDLFDLMFISNTVSAAFRRSSQDDSHVFLFLSFDIPYRPDPIDCLNYSKDLPQIR